MKIYKKERIPPKKPVDLNSESIKKWQKEFEALKVKIAEEIKIENELLN